MAQTREGALKIAAKKAGVSLTEYITRVDRGLKWCFRCRDWHSRDQFGSDRSRYDGLATACRKSISSCVRAQYKHRERSTTVWTTRPQDAAYPTWMMRLPTRIRDRLRRNGTCWEWHGCRNDRGYGKVHFNGTLWLVHRLVRHLVVADVVADRLVLHHCDNPPCANPEHTFVGTHQDNVTDKVNKGRQLKGDDAWQRLHPERVLRGENSHLSKLTTQQVCEIIRRHSAGATQRELGSEFGIHPNHIGRIWRGERWAEVFFGHRREYP